jgi:TolA-binding protein
METSVDPAVEAKFVEGWRRLQRHEYAAAAQLFKEVIRTAPGSPLVEDAAYWRTVALSSEGLGSEAAGAMQSFLSSYPRSERAGKVRVALGWLRLKSGARQLARESFEEALEDSDPEVREAARQGLRFME